MPVVMRITADSCEIWAAIQFQTVSTKILIGRRRRRGGMQPPQVSIQPLYAGGQLWPPRNFIPTTSSRRVHRQGLARMAPPSSCKDPRGRYQGGPSSVHCTSTQLEAALDAHGTLEALGIM